MYVIEDTTDLAKAATRFVVKRSVATCIATAITAVVPVETKREKAQVFIGSYVLGEMAAEHAGAYANQEFEKAVDLVRKLKMLIKNETPTQ